jgi:hypothetical protein
VGQVGNLRADCQSAPRAKEVGMKLESGRTNGWEAAHEHHS